ncbi:MAG: GGDEF domain-containing protein, partial [Spirochaetota bacterium]
RDLAERQAPVAEMTKAAALWRVSHDGLLKGSAELGLYGRNSPTVIALFAKIEPSFLAMLDAATILGKRALEPGIAGPELGFLTSPLLRRENEFLTGMNEITFQYDRETRDRLSFIRFLEYALLGITCLALALEALFIFLPAERQINRYFRDMKRAVMILKEQATYDEMTGIFNKHTGLMLLSREMDKARRLRSALSLCFIDLDGLKVVNDGFGHEEGDLLIKGFASMLREAIRDEDAAFRFGGDEFVLVLTCDVGRAESIIERIRRMVDSANASSAKPWTLGFSHGIAAFETEGRMSPEDFIKKADVVMYREKEAHKARGLSPRRAD